MKDEQELARKIVHHLDRGVGKIKQDTLSRLQMARKAALERYREPQPVFGLAWAGNIGQFFSRGRMTITHYLILAALLVASAAGITYYWQFVSDDDTDIEISLLTGELPINAYLDSEFEAWLKRSSE